MLAMSSALIGSAAANSTASTARRSSESSSCRAHEQRPEGRVLVELQPALPGQLQRGDEARGERRLAELAVLRSGRKASIASIAPARRASAPAG
jgi:hypothetical protein